jgi:hypothetical protein
MFVRAGVTEVVPTVLSWLDEPLGYKKHLWQQAHDWFATKSDDDKQMIQFLVREAAASAAVGIAVEFDGAAGFEDVEGKAAEFVVSLRVYRDRHYQPNDVAQEIVEICPPSHGEEVHDIVMNLLDAGQE